MASNLPRYHHLMLTDRRTRIPRPTNRHRASSSQSEQFDNVTSAPKLTVRSNDAATNTVQRSSHFLRLTRACDPRHAADSIVALCYWIAKAQVTVSVVASLHAYPNIIALICIIVAMVTCIVDVVLSMSLRTCYRQAPGNILAFYPSPCNKKVIYVSIIISHQ